MLEVKNLCFSYNKKDQVLTDISFKANYGDCIAVLGKNGVGKSTLMKCIINNLKPQQGEIILDGLDISKLKSNKRAQLIGYVPQELSFANGTVYDAILIGRKPYFSYAVRDHDLDIVDEVIKKLHIEHLSFKNINDLSGGERQKVAIARALVQQPKLLYLDEPTSNLDIKNQLEVLDLVNELAHQENIIVLINIHNINLVVNYFTTMLLLKDGKVLKEVNKQNEITSEDIKQLFDINVDIVKSSNQEKYIILKEKKKL